MTNRSPTDVAGPSATPAPSVAWPGDPGSNGHGPGSAPGPKAHRPLRRVRKVLLGLTAAALIAAAFALVVAALSPQQRAEVTRPLQPGASTPPATATAPPSATPTVTLAPPDPGTVGRQIDQRLTETRQVERAAATFRWMGLAGALLLMGMAVFLLVVFPNDGSETSPFEGQGRLRGLTILIVLMTVIGSLGELPLRAAIEGTMGWAGASDPDTLLFVAAGPVAVSALLRIAGVLLILAMLVGRFGTVKRPFSVVRGGLALVGGVHISGRTSRRVAMMVGIAVTTASFLVVGHAQASKPRVLLMAADVTHVLAASVWLGGVTMLTVMLRRLRRLRKAAPVHAPDPGLRQARREMAVIVGRFSVAATFAVAGVTVAGVALAASQLGGVDALYRTAYGITLVTKLVLVGFVMLLGGYNHRFLVPRVIENDADERAWRRMRQLVLVEVLVILFGVLTATIALSSGGFANLAV